MKHNQMLEHLGFGITKEDEDIIVYYLERDPQDDYSESISVVSDLSKAILFSVNEPFGQREVKGPLACIRLIQEFFEKPVIKY